MHEGPDARNKFADYGKGRAEATGRIMGLELGIQAGKIPCPSLDNL